MKQVQERPVTPEATRIAPHLALWQVNLLRVGYLVMGVGLAVVTWPLLLDRSSWTLEKGTIDCMLMAMSLLALVGIRYPVRMLPLLLFEVTWKLIWLGAVALPLWWDDQLDGATRDQTGAVLWVVIIIAVIPWRHVLAQYAKAPAEPSRR